MPAALALSAPQDDRDEAAARGRLSLVGNFLQMVELHYRDGWPVARYAADQAGACALRSIVCGVAVN